MKISEKFRIPEKLSARLEPVWAFCRRRPRLSGVIGAAAVLMLGALLLRGGDGAEGNEFFTVKRGSFLVSIVEGGNLAAVKEEVVRNELEGESRIIYIVPEGTYVKKGDLVVELDPGEAEDALIQQQITYEKSLADHTAAENALIIMRSTVESEVSTAEIAVEIAKLNLNKFDQMDREQQVRIAEIDIISAEEELQIAEQTLANTEELAKRKFETKNQLDLDRLKVTNGKLAVEKAKRVKEMLEQFGLSIESTDLKSKLEEAERELVRVRKQGESSLAQATADLDAAKKTLDLNKAKLDKMEEQFKATKLYAPQDGLVVYAVGESRFSNESLVEEGASVRNRQEIIKIPDTSEMKVSLKVHESHISQVREGQDAFVVLDSMPDQRFRAVVSKVALLPDTQSRWGNPNLKVYSTEILIKDSLPDIKPGVSARAEIVVTNLQNVITVPIQAVTTVKGQQVCYVDSIGGPKPVPVSVGLYNNKFIEITSGLEAGDRILLAPPLNTEVDLGGGVIDSEESDDLGLSSERPQPQAGGPTSGGAGGPGGPEAGGPRGERPQPPGGGGDPGQGSGRPGRGEGGGRGPGEGGPPAGGAESGEGSPGAGRQGRGGDAWKQFDKDGDGTLSDSEKEEMRKALTPQPPSTSS